MSDWSHRSIVPSSAEGIHPPDMGIALVHVFTPSLQTVVDIQCQKVHNRTLHHRYSRKFWRRRKIRCTDLEISSGRTIPTGSSKRHLTRLHQRRRRQTAYRQDVARCETVLGLA